MTIAATWSASFTAEASSVVRVSTSRVDAESARARGRSRGDRRQSPANRENRRARPRAAASGPPPNNNRRGGGATDVTNSSTSSCGARTMDVAATRIAVSCSSRSAASAAGEIGRVFFGGERHSERDGRHAARDHERDSCGIAAPPGRGQVRQGLPAFVGAHPRQQHIHGAFAPGAEPEELIRAGAQVIAHDACGAARGDFSRVLAQVAFEAATRQKTGVFAIGGDQHLRAGLGIGRAHRCG